MRDLSIPEIFAQLRYEGHPFLWYALLWPLARVGLPFESILVLSTALMAGAAAVLVRFAPLPWYAKAACLFSVPFIYYLPTVARSYALAGLLLVLCAALYGTRHTKPLRYGAVLFLMCQVHVMLCGFVGFLMAQWALEMLVRSARAKRLAGADAGALALMAGGVLLLVVQLAGSVQTNTQIDLRTQSIVQTAQDFLGIGFKTQMCIRDRCWASTEQYAMQNCTISSFLVSCAISAMFIGNSLLLYLSGPYRTCLLYTSRCV